MKHIIKYYLYFTTYIKDYLELDPSEYMDCDNEDEVRDVIWDIIFDEIDISGSSDLEDDILTIPNEFWEEWRKLKENDK